MALSGYKEFATGEVLTASDVNAYLMQAVMVFADSSARDAGIPSAKREEGQFVFLKSDNSLQFYDGSSFVNFIGDGDITGVTAGTGLSGGGTSGAVTLNVDINGTASGTIAGADEILFADVDDSNTVKKTTATAIVDLGGGGSAFSEFLLIGA